MKKIFETAIILFATFGFWGMIYPDLCFTDEVCRTFRYDETDMAGINQDEDTYENIEYDEMLTEEDAFAGIWEAHPDKIVIKSKLLDAWDNYMNRTNASAKESKGKTNVNNRYGKEGGTEPGSGGSI